MSVRWLGKCEGEKHYWCQIIKLNHYLIVTNICEQLQISLEDVNKEEKSHTMLFRQEINNVLIGMGHASLNKTCRKLDFNPLNVSVSLHLWLVSTIYTH